MASILIVEDEPNIALGLEDDLSLEGYEVHIAPDGETALSLTRENPFDLVLLDIMLPGKDGFAVCRELRRSGISTPIIMLTAKDQEAEKVIGLELGADDYITKPFSPLELRARIKAVLRRADRDTPATYRFGDVELDFSRCELQKAGQLIEITSLEFKLLSAFVRHKGVVLTRQQLLDEVWGHGTFVTDRVVDNHVTNLRKKIESKPSQPRYLVSLRGLGYRFDG